MNGLYLIGKDNRNINLKISKKKVKVENRDTKKIQYNKGKPAIPAIRERWSNK